MPWKSPLPSTVRPPVPLPMLNCTEFAGPPWPYCTWFEGATGCGWAGAGLEGCSAGFGRRADLPAIGIASSGAFSACLGGDCVSPFDGLASTLVFGVDCSAGSGILLTAVTVIAPEPAPGPPHACAPRCIATQAQPSTTSVRAA